VNVKLFRALLASLVLVGAILLGTAQPAAACGFSDGWTGCPTLEVFKSGEHNFGLRIGEAPNFNDPTKYAQGATVEELLKMQQAQTHEDWLDGKNNTNWEQLGFDQVIGCCGGLAPEAPSEPASQPVTLGGGGNTDVLCAFDYSC
jgi:hypothetical protein